MRFNFTALLLAPTLLLAPACDDTDDTMDSDGDGGGQDIYVTDWQTAVEVDFTAEDRSGEEVPIEELFIGGPEKDGNFINRGDVEVYFNTDDTIKVEYRKFIVANTKEEAEGNLDKFNFWAWAKDPPSPPGELEDTPEVECNNDHWNDACHIRAWYEGQKQPDRIGMDFRVYLPEGWDGKLTVRTEDNMAEKEVYPDRSDITIMGVTGPLEVYGEGGNVNISRAKGASEVLECSDDELKMCQDGDWDDIGGDGCKCDQFGTILVDMIGAATVNITLNNDSMLTQVVLTNNDDTLKETSDLICEAFFDCEGMADCDMGPIDDREETWALTHYANVPESAQKGIGFNVTVDVGSCVESNFVEGPGDFGSPKSEARGYINVCAEAGDKCPKIEAP